MGLTSWKNSSDGKILKTDVSIAKKCLSGFGRRESKTENIHDNTALYKTISLKAILTS